MGPIQENTIIGQIVGVSEVCDQTMTYLQNTTRLKRSLRRIMSFMKIYLYLLCFRVLRTPESWSKLFCLAVFNLFCYFNMEKVLLYWSMDQYKNVQNCRGCRNPWIGKEVARQESFHSCLVNQTTEFALKLLQKLFFQNRNLHSPLSFFSPLSCLWLVARKRLDLEKDL